MNETMIKFGYPNTIIHEAEHWTVLLRPQQATLGALILACTEPANRYGELSLEAFVEQQQLIKGIENALSSAFGYEKINYLMLMMVDPDVHFHVLPRYSEPQLFAGTTFADPGWPGPPELAYGIAVDDDLCNALIEHITGHWSR